MRISLLVPCFNEEKSLHKSIASWLDQTRPIDEIIIVDDSSTDLTPQILSRCKGRITVVTTPRNSGNKSYAQEYGLRFVTGEVVITTDGDTQLDRHFAERIEKDFQNPHTVAVAGFVRSLKYNWLTACRALDYAVVQNLDKVAQQYMRYIFVIPGAAGAFRTETFRTIIGFDHDTLTEDLDFTYKLHRAGYAVEFDRLAVCYTQDPSNLRSYINQMRRWYGGGWQNLMKHIHIPNKPAMAFELSLVYTEGLIFSILAFVLPFINIFAALVYVALSSLVAVGFATFAAYCERRLDFFAVLPGYIFLRYVNAYIFVEQFFKEVVLGDTNMVWFKPDRVSM